MSRPGTVILAVTLLALAGSGCGTQANLDGRALPLISTPGEIKPMPFGGVVRDAQWVHHVATFDPEHPVAGALCSTIFVLDMPFSLVGDVVTLPQAFIAARNYKSPFATEPSPERATPPPAQPGVADQHPAQLGIPSLSRELQTPAR